jgi:hypothetical protein
MNKLKTLLCLLLLSACTTDNASDDAQTDSEEFEVLYRVPEGEVFELGENASYVNQDGETIVPAGKYTLYYTDTIHYYGIVRDKNTLLAIDTEGKKLYEVFQIDNGPDYASEGLFRIIKNGKIGYADAITGEVVIEPSFKCANAFEDGKAKVALNCEVKRHEGDEYSTVESDEWYFINQDGEQVE